MEDFLIFFFIGFFAQLVDGALGMAYGLTTTTLLLSFGLPPLTASAITHAAECITTGFSAFAHHRLGNISHNLFKRLLIPGIIGVIVGVIVLTHVDGNLIKPYVACYLLVMGVIVLSKAFMIFPPKGAIKHLIPLGFFGALLDAIGGGGWGAIVTSTLIAQGHDPRTAIGSVNASEFFIATVASLGFFLGNVLIGWQTVAALALGGALAAPLGALICKYIPVRILLFVVGSFIIGLSCRTLWMAFNAV